MDFSSCSPQNWDSWAVTLPLSLSTSSVGEVTTVSVSLISVQYVSGDSGSSGDLLPLFYIQIYLSLVPVLCLNLPSGRLNFYKFSPINICLVLHSVFFFSFLSITASGVGASLPAPCLGSTVFMRSFFFFLIS